MKKLAFLGPHGTNSEEAAIYMANLRKEKMNLVAYNTIQDAIQAVAQKDVDYCLVPVENSIEGSVRITLDTLAHDVDLMIESELIWSVHNQLLTKNPNAKIHTIISHIQPLAQCREYLKSHYPMAKTESVSSTARAAEKASCYGDGYAAIATKTAADLYNLQIIDTDIQDVEDNFTRFILLTNKDKVKKYQDVANMMIICQIDGRAGSLYELLGDFACRKVNMTRIESRPARTSLGEYIFFIEIDANVDKDILQEALMQASKKCFWLKNLGKFPVYKASNKLVNEIN
ncbi:MULTISPECIES: prephenate dehydratase [Megamonas]|uniref:prephenate dehydratase n=1 Tax=Megamonas TaxID=158846 RepID=UPI001EC4F8FE|nr:MULTISPECIES: prephenate dehydratase [Megamonas]MBD9296208.1 prephenate dehydratase [Megamonas funiformis]MBS7212358.1 prephenate dehydratase [Megamonas funiformis]